MNKKFLTIGSSGIAAVLVVLVIVSYDDNSIHTQEFVIGPTIIPEPTMNTVSESPMTPPPRPIMRLITHPVLDIDMASQIAKVNVSENLLIPKGYDVVGISANPDSKTFKMLLSQNKVTESTTQKEFYANGGILIFIEDQSEANIDRASWSEKWIESNNGERITVNGKSGLTHNIVNISYADGSLVTNPAKVVFYDDNVLYKVTGIINPSDLLRIAESI